jgi:hypothetical protein
MGKNFKLEIVSIRGCLRGVRRVFALSGDFFGSVLKLQ